MKNLPIVHIDNALWRERVIERVLGTPPESARMTIVSAPAGFGKTTLLAQLAQRARANGVQVAWMNCDARDADPQFFAESLLAAIEPCDIDIGGEPGRSDHVAAAIASVAEPLALFIDDYDTAVCAAIDEVIEFIALALPRHVGVTLACRCAPGAQMARLQLAGRVRFVDAELLRFSRDETRALMDGALSGPALDDVVAHTEGWAFALQLARLRAAGGSPEDWVIDAGARVPRRQIFDYLAREVLATLVQATIAFLTDIAVLEQADVAAANAVRQHGNSLEFIRELSVLKPVVVIDESTWTAHLHPLLRDYLLHRLDVEMPGQAQVLHLRAAEHFARMNLIDVAVRHAVAASRFDVAAQLIESAGGIRLLVTLGEAGVRILLQQLPLSALQRSPRLRLLQIALRIQNHDASGARTELGRVAQMIDDAGLADDADERVDLQLARCMLLLDDSERQLSFSPWAALQDVLESGRSRFVEDPLFLGFALPVDIFFLHRYGPRERCERRTREVEETMRSVKPLNSSPWLWIYHARNAYARGELERCEEIVGHTLKRDLNFVKHGQKSLGQLVTIVHGKTLFRQGRLVEALAQFSAIVPTEAVQFLEVLAAIHVDAAQCEFWLGNGARAMELLASARQFAFEENLPHLGMIAAAAEVELAIASGEGPRARAIASAMRLDDQWRLAQPGFVLPWISVETLGRAVFAIELQRGSATEALETANRLLALSQQAGQRLAEIASRTMRACAFGALRDVPACDEHLAEALAMAQRAGAPQVFIEMGTQVMPRIRELAQSGPHAIRSFAAQVLQLWDAAFFRGLNASNLFTERELEVLRELAKDHTTKMIAKTVMRSPETVKFHLKAIFAKLGVSTREDAVAEARRRALMP